jgi:VWFA-related protein
MKRFKSKSKILFLILLAGAGLISSFLLFPAQQKKLEYEVSVDAQIIPMYAVDSQGNPVFDLEKQDLELRVNGKSVPIYLLNLFRFQHQSEILETRPSGTLREQPLLKPPIQRPKRVVFLIIDFLNLGNLKEYKKAKKITRQLIMKGSAHDAFVLMTYAEGPGLKYLGGPTRNKEALLKKLEQMKSDFISYKPYKGLLNSGKQNETASGRFYYLNCFDKLKYSLRAITEPKTVLLVSGSGMPLGLHNDRLFFEDLARSMNEGGVTLNAIYAGISPLNTSAEDFQNTSADNSQDTSAGNSPGDVDPNVLDNGSLAHFRNMSVLKRVAETSGGMYYSQPEPEHIVKAVRETTSAYYELTFIPPKGKKINEFDIEVKCNRKGVSVHAIRYSKIKKQYARMSKVQKELFALDILINSRWNGVTGKVTRAPYEILKSGLEGREKYYQIQVKIPGKIRGKKADIFLIRFDPDSQEVKIKTNKKVLGEKEILGLKTRKNMKVLYFVMVEPTSAFSIYNQVVDRKLFRE